MNLVWGSGRSKTIAAGCLALALMAAWAQKRPAAPPNASATRSVLADKARALETRGRADMAMQIWQQILLSDPNNAEALAGLARAQKLTGANDKAAATLDRLRRVNPHDANIDKIQALASTHAQSAQLSQAGELARAGRPDEAMRVYRQIYGNRPPDGEIALGYYQTLYATASGRAEAVAGMRGLAARNPGVERYAVELGTMLTYDAKTRAEGERILSAHPKAANAAAALRQALVWDAQNPRSAAAMRPYVKEHPEDKEVAGMLEKNEGKLKEMAARGNAPSSAERAGFIALNAHRLEDAQRLFAEVLEREPKNGRVLAGLGYVRMQQKNFTAAIGYFTQAEQNGNHAVAASLSNARFWAAMNEATQAFDAGQMVLAAARYRDALELNPRSPEALNGLAGLYVKQQRYEAAAELDAQLIKVQPAGLNGWRGLFLAHARGGRQAQAFEVQGRFPASVRAALDRDPEFLQTLAALDQAAGRPAEAQRVLAAALALPAPRGAAMNDAKLQYAGLLMEARRYAQAVPFYAQVLATDPSNSGAWTGLVSAHHSLGQDDQAIADVQKMPAAVYESALSDANFLAMLGSIYQTAHRYDVAQGLLERAVREQSAAGGQPTLELQLQLASVYLERGETEKAYAIDRQILTHHPERADAWKGVIASLNAAHRETEAVAELAQIPAATRQKLDQDIEFVQLEAGLLAATGETQRALALMTRVDSYYAQRHAEMPPAMALQRAWLLYNTGSDAQLYPALMRLGGRTDLSAADRSTVQNLWANWSVRRAATALNNGNQQRAVEILDAAYQAFPDNMEVRKAVAGGYAQVGRTKEALAIYRTIPLEQAAVSDYQGAIGAALAANDKAQAELWLRQAIELYPRNASILTLAARYEQSRGDGERAAAYYRAALAAMPTVTPADRLAHMMSAPEQDERVRRAATPADLQRLLDPNNEPLPRTTKLPALPAYGPDPYGGSAPVVIGAQENSPTHFTDPSANDSLIHPVPAAGAPGQAHWQLQSLHDERPWTLLPAVYHAPTQHAELRLLTVAQVTGRKKAKKNRYEGQMHLPPDEQVVGSDGDVATQDRQSWTPELQAPATGLRISAEPMNPEAARVLALFAAETDSQLTTGSAMMLQSVPAPPTTVRGTLAEGQTGRYAVAQYTPSPQQAVAGAFSASRASEPATTVPTPVAVQQNPAESAVKTAVTPRTPPVRNKSRAGQTHAAGRLARAPRLPVLPQEQPTPSVSAPVAAELAPAPAMPQTQAPGGAGLTDEQLQQRNLPPLRGPWVRVQRAPRLLTPREEAEQQLQSLESGNSGWLGGTGMVSYRSGNPGFDQLTALEAPFEASIAGFRARLSVIAKPVFLDSGQADGTAEITVVESTTSGTAQEVIPTPIGTLTATNTTLPAQQNAAGIAGEVQLALPTFAIAGGTTPYGFLVQTFTGRLYWRPGNGPVSFNLSRDSVKDSQLSYAGLRDPAGDTLGVQGQIWGGVVANQGTFQIARGDAQSGYYFSVGGQTLEGYHVQHNSRFDGGGGAYWRAYADPEYGNLNVGVNFFAMHYAKNQNAFTYGMGGYFSPQAYFLANVPLTWTGHYLTRWHYTIGGGLGLQAFQEDKAVLWPLSGNAALETSMSYASLPAKTSVGANFDLHGQAGYQISPHWMATASFGANNTRDYKAGSFSFSIHYLFRAQPSTVSGPTGIFPADGLRPMRVP